MPRKSQTENVTSAAGAANGKPARTRGTSTFNSRTSATARRDDLIKRHAADFVEAKTEARRAITAKL